MGELRDKIQELWDVALDLMVDAPFPGFADTLSRGHIPKYLAYCEGTALPAKSFSHFCVPQLAPGIPIEELKKVRC